MILIWFCGNFGKFWWKFRGSIEKNVEKFVEVPTLQIYPKSEIVNTNLKKVLWK